MRKFVISLAAAGAALAVASPAAAQYYSQPQYGYAQPGYGSGYGYNNGGWGQARALQARLNNVERQIDRLDRRDRIRDGSADRLRYEAERIEQRLRYSARGGLNPYEMRDIDVRIARLEQRVQYAMNQWGGRYGYNNSGWNDRDRDGRWERRRDDDDRDHD